MDSDKVLIKTKDGELIQFEMSFSEFERLDKQIKTIKELYAKERELK